MNHIGRNMILSAAIAGTCLIFCAPTETAAQIDQPENSATGEYICALRRIPGLFTDKNNVAASVTVINAEQIRRLNASTIQEIIAKAAGSTFSDQQGFGLASDGTLNLRGIVNSSRTNALVLLDGVRQNRITGDEVHWQSIPVDQIESIEIIRGSGGMIYGEGALAGVINIITKQAGKSPLETEAGYDLGSFGWQRYRLGISGKNSQFDFGMNYSRRLLDGYRESSWSRNTTISTYADLELNPMLRTSVHVHHSEDTTAFPGGLTQAQTDQRRIQTNPFHGFNENTLEQVSMDIVAGPWAGTSMLLNGFFRKWVQSSQDSINFNSFTITPSRGLNIRTDTEWTGRWLHNFLVSGVELGEDKATTGDRDSIPGPDNESNRRGYGLYLEDTLSVLERISLVGGLRYDRSRYTESLSFPTFEGTLRFHGFSPKAAVSVAAIPQSLNIFASYSRPFKAPNIDDLSARLSTFTGNINLEPQQATTYELGLNCSRKNFHTSATWFSTLIDDEILVNGLTSQSQNFDTRRVGLELSSQVEISKRIRTYVDYTVLDSWFRDGPFKNKSIPGTPRHTLNTGLGISPIEYFWIDLDWQVVNDFFRINDMQNKLGKADNYGVLNLSFQYELPKRLKNHGIPSFRTYLKIENITNEEYVTFQSSNGQNVGGAGQYPMPPTTFSAGLTFNF